MSWKWYSKKKWFIHRFLLQWKTPWKKVIEIFFPNRFSENLLDRDFEINFMNSEANVNTFE
jgi:hypothetical protein